MIHTPSKESMEEEFELLTKSMDGQYRPKLRLLIQKTIDQAIAEERRKCVEFMRSYPLSEDFVFNDGWWEVGHKAIDEVADALEGKEKNDKAKAKLHPKE